MNIKMAGQLWKKLLCLVLVLLLFIAGCAVFNGNKSGSLMETARRQFDKNQYTIAVHSLSDLIRNYPLSAEVAQAYYLRGLCYRQIGPEKNDQAKLDFEQTIKKSKPNSNLRRLCHVAMGHLFFETNPPENDSQAIEHYKKALDGMENKQPKDAVLYRLGTALQRLGQWPAADAYLSQCFNLFPKSSFAEYAKTRFGVRAFKLQIAVVSDIRRARELIEKLRKSGWTAGWNPIWKDDKTLYAVRTGNYQTYDLAIKALAQLQEVQPQAIIVPGP
jgi:tetratricopeptide (TPR) repeat protein